METGRRLIPTKLGIALVRGYQRVDPDLILPTMRADVEKKLDLIAKGKADYQKMKDSTLEVFRLKFNNFVQNIQMVDELFEGFFVYWQNLYSNVQIPSRHSPNLANPSASVGSAADT